MKSQAFCEVTLRISGAAVLAWLMLGACNRDLPNNNLPTSAVERGKGEAGAGLYSSLAIDQTGQVHVAYFHSDLGAARHALWNGEKWAIATIEAPQDKKAETGRQIRLVAASGKLYAAYQAAQFNDGSRETVKSEHVRFAVSDNGATWLPEDVDTSSFRTGDFIALGVAGGRPVAAYYDASNGDLMFGLRDQGKWTVKALDKSGNVGKYVSMDVGAAGYAHLAYYDASYGGLKYLRRTDETVTIEKVDGFAAGTSDAENVGTWTAIRAQPLNSVDVKAVQPKIVYYDEARHRLNLAERIGDDSWTTSLIDEGPFVGTDSAFVWLSTGDLIVAYFDEYNLDLKLARRTDSGWSRQTLLSQGAVGMYNSLAALPGGKLAISTYSLSRGELQYLLLPVRP